jgi:tetratricopeptide (TPR) repeat protein
MLYATRINRIYLITLLVLSTLTLGSAALAQTEDPEALKARAEKLIAEQKFTEALPLYEKLAILFPKDSNVYRNFGFSLLGQSANTDDAAARRQLRIRARQAFINARDLGDQSLLVRGMLDGLPEDGRDGQGFSDNAEANKVMQRAEGFFSSGKMDDAFKAYQEALALDPRCYFAALFSGDVMLHTNRFNEAEKWYQRAIAIDPYIETAYRYSATPLMKQGKFDLARERYVEAYITQPYSKLAQSGLVQWAETTRTSLGHPRLNIPKTSVGPDGKKNTTINVNPVSDDGSMAWIAYSATREVWEKEKFKKTFPNESQYRHTLAEEVDALRSVVSMAKTVKAKKLSEDIAMIEKMDRDGVLEAYVLLAIADDGIARDHRDYLKRNRDRLRLYVTKYVIGAER